MEELPVTTEPAAAAEPAAAEPATVEAAAAEPATVEAAAAEPATVEAAAAEPATVEAAVAEAAAAEPAVAETAAAEPAVAETAAAEPAVAETAETGEVFGFSADISQLMSIIVNTFYSNRDIFLRELISNASDALDKLRYQSLTSPEALKDNDKLEIRISLDSENKTLTIEDSGIGMTRDELINNLGTIAKSGTKTFMEAMEKGADMSMIGQFGVGFYSAYLVADMVKVVSKSVLDETWCWTSRADGCFRISEGEKGDIKRGTKITLFLKENSDEFLQEKKIRDIVNKHSNFVNFNILLKTTKKEEVEEEVEKEVEEEEVAVKEGDEVVVEDVDETIGDENKQEVKDENIETKKTRKKMVTTVTWDHLNKIKPLWTWNPADVTHEQYAAFYKSALSDWEDHAAVKHFKMEGTLEFTAMLFLPNHAPFDLFAEVKNKKNIKLYVRRIFITDEFDSLVPPWLSFMRGIVDSNDMPLNISREVLQESRILKVVSKQLVKKSLELFASLDDEKYKKFYSNFSKSLKMGLYDDDKYRNKLVPFLRYDTTKRENISLEDYIKEMRATQENIYFITAGSLEEAKASPLLEQLKKHDIECLLMVEPLDEYIVQKVTEYEGKKLVSVAKDGFNMELSEDEKNQFEAAVKTCENLCKKMKKVLGDAVEKVVVSPRIVDSPCCLVAAQHGHSANMLRILKAQPLTTSYQGLMPPASKILEINHKHKIVRMLQQKLEEDSSDKVVKDLIWLMYDTTLLASGFTLDKPVKFASRIHKLVSLGLMGDDDTDDETDDELDDYTEKRGIEKSQEEKNNKLDAIGKEYHETAVRFISDQIVSGEAFKKKEEEEDDEDLDDANTVKTEVAEGIKSGIWPKEAVEEHVTEVVNEVVDDVVEMDMEAVD